MTTIISTTKITIVMVIPITKPPPPDAGIIVEDWNGLGIAKGIHGKNKGRKKYIYR